MKYTVGGVTKSMTRTSIKSRSIAKVNDNLLVLLIDRGRLAFSCCLLHLKPLTPILIANIN